MGSLSRSQLLVYGAVAVTLLLVGARWIRSADSRVRRRRGELLVGVRLLRLAPAARSASTPQGGEDVVVDVAGAVGEPGRLQAARRDRASTTPCSAPAAPPRGPSSRGSTSRRGSPTGSKSSCPAGPPALRGRRRASSAAATADGPISLGTATVEELDTIEGIGPVTAQNIIDFRDQHGGVSSVDQLDQIDGIGPATMDALRARLQP